MRILAFPIILLSVLFVFQSQISHRKTPTTGYPYALKEIEITSQRQVLTMMYMHEKAQKENGKTILLLHGKNFTGAYWGEVMKKLLAQGYNVVAPDQIGFGESALPENYQYSFQQLAKNTKELLDSLRIKKVVVLGHSMGGMLATRFALMYPETVSQLILENPIGLEDWKLMAPYTSVDDEYKKELGKTKESVKNYFMANYFHNEWKEEYNSLLASATTTIGTADYSKTAWSMALTSDMVFNQPVLYEFSELKVPTVLIIGQKDRTAIGKDKVSKEKAAEMGNYPALGKATKDKIPNAVLIEMPDAGHIPHIEQTEFFMSHLLNALEK